MPETRYQVFVSSTFRDLVEERAAVIGLIQAMDHIPAGMELFPSSDSTPWDVIRRVIDFSDYYVLIVGGKYGSTREDGISYTEAEYDYAASSQVPVLAFLHGAPDEIPKGKSELDPDAESRLTAFRDKVEARHTCTYWTTPGELKGQVAASLVTTITRCPGVGWVRGSTASESSSLLRQLNDVRIELEEVRRENQELRARELNKLRNVSQPLLPVTLQYVDSDAGTDEMCLETYGGA